MLIFSISVLATDIPFYAAPLYNASDRVTDIVLVKEKGIRSNGNASLAPDGMPKIPMIPHGHVLVGVGATACKQTLCRIHLWSREVNINGSLGPILLSKFGSVPEGSLENYWRAEEDAIAIVGLGFGIEQDQVKKIEVQYKRIINGELSNAIELGSSGSYTTEAMVSSSADVNEVITGLGFRNDSSNVNSLWVYKGTFREVLALAPVDQYSMSARKGSYVPIDIGGILAPIQLEAPAILLKGQQATLEFSNNTMSGVIRTPVTRMTVPGQQTYGIRPTLIVSIHGFQGLTGDGHLESSTWQFLVSKQLTPYLDLGLGQFKHFMVDWHSNKRNRLQVEDVADHLEEFLDARIEEWDVLLVGHSRGGIFAHELSKKLLGKKNIHSLRTALLDPTAVSAMGDTYPHSLYKSSKTPHSGVVYFDQECVEEWSGSCGGGASFGDMPIDGYSEQIMKGPHDEYGKSWLADVNGFEAEIARLLADKEVFPAGSFEHDFTVAPTKTGVLAIQDDLDSVIKVHIDDVYIVIDGEVGDDYVEMYAEMAIGEVSMGGYAYAGVNGIEASANLMFLAASAGIREDYVGAHANVGIAAMGASLSEDDGANVHFSGLVASYDAHIELEGVSVSSDIFGSDHETGISITSGGSSASIAGFTLFSL